LRAEIVARLVAAMKQAGLDAVVTVSPENFGWLNGFVVPSQPLMRHRHAMSIVTADGRTALVAVDMEETTVRNRAPDMPVRIWAEFTCRQVTSPRWCVRCRVPASNRARRCSRCCASRRPPTRSR
jgi:Xaa-Pro aminopeptidase